MLTLHTFGSVYVADQNGLPLGGAAAQRRLLALLAVLAVAGERGLSRDKLVSLFWPEGDPDKARHSLTQSLYHTRKALLADDLFIGTGDVRLNPQRLLSDVREMEEAVAAGDLVVGHAAQTDRHRDVWRRVPRRSGSCGPRRREARATRTRSGVR